MVSSPSQISSLSNLATQLINSTRPIIEKDPPVEKERQSYRTKLTNLTAALASYDYSLTGTILTPPDSYEVASAQKNFLALHMKVLDFLDKSMAVYKRGNWTEQAFSNWFEIQESIISVFKKASTMFENISSTSFLNESMPELEEFIREVIEPLYITNQEDQQDSLKLKSLRFAATILRDRIYRPVF